VAEHAATTSATAAAHIVPAAEKIAAAAMSAERTATGMAFFVALVMMSFVIKIEVALVMTLMHGVKEVVQTHVEILYR
jgi:hypothetical protein